MKVKIMSEPKKPNSCPECGEEDYFFSDEEKEWCHRCGHREWFGPYPPKEEKD